jgi:Fibronectin type III domain
VEQHPVLAEVKSGLALGLVAAAVAGCSAAPPRPSAGLSAKLVSPTEIVLSWQGSEPDVAGRVVEYATEPGGPYTILRFAPPNETTFTHPELIPETPFYYRVRAYHGPVSGEVEVVLPAGEEVDPRDSHEWVDPRTLPERVATASIRDGQEAAAPADLRATVKHANGIHFTWSDRAGDEEGFLLEARPAGSAQFQVVALIDPNINSFGLITLPQEKRAAYRVRAFYYGEQSNVAHQKTGQGG